MDASWRRPQQETSCPRSFLRKCPRWRSITWVKCSGAVWPFIYGFIDSLFFLNWSLKWQQSRSLDLLGRLLWLLWGMCEPRILLRSGCLPACLLVFCVHLVLHWHFGFNSVQSVGPFTHHIFLRPLGLFNPCADSSCVLFLFFQTSFFFAQLQRRKDFHLKASRFFLVEAFI